MENPIKSIIAGMVFVALAGSALFVYKLQSSSGGSFANAISSGMRTNNLKDLVEKAIVCERKCPPEEADLARRTKEVYQAFIKSGDSFEEYFPRYIEVMKDAILYYSQKPDFVVQHDLYSAGIKLNKMMVSLGKSNEDFEKILGEKVATLKESFPNQAKTYLLLAEYSEHQRASTQDLMDLYAKCIRLDRNEKECLEQYHHLKDIALRKRCLSEDINDDLKVLIEGRQLMSKGDLEYILPSRDARQQPILLAFFTEQGRAKFAQLTENNIGKKLKVMLGDLTLSTATIQEKIDVSRAVVTLPGKSKEQNQEIIGELCKKMTQPQLPGHLLIDEK